MSSAAHRAKGASNLKDPETNGVVRFQKPARESEAGERGEGRWKERVSSLFPLLKLYKGKVVSMDPPDFPRFVAPENVGSTLLMVGSTKDPPWIHHRIHLIDVLFFGSTFR